MPRHDSLQAYRDKRDFHKTPEPQALVPARSGHRYLIQKHNATRLHYDFRLELDGVLKSWAVTRGPSLDPGEKRLAVEVEDHPVAYGSFEGIIPKGQYGGGTVMLWDEGTWEPIGDPHQGLQEGKLVFKLKGRRLRGEWTLVRMRDREKDRGRHNWLLIKHRDELAKSGDADGLTTRNTTSIASGRSMERIAAAADHVWSSQEEESQNGKSHNEKSHNENRPARSRSNFVPPQLASLADAVPSGDQWVHEIKFDGYRAITIVHDQTARIFTRTGRDWTQKFPSLATLLAQLPIKSVTLDGEIVCVNPDGGSSFGALQKTLKKGADDGLQYYVFDLLELNGIDWKPRPLRERKAELAKLLKTPLGNRVIYSEHFTSDGEKLLKKLCGLHGEGIISKLADAPYVSGRGRSWLKSKCHARQEFAIGGYTLPSRGNRGIGALLLGYHDKNQLVFAGKVGTGFDQSSRQLLREKLDALSQKSLPFSAVPADAQRGAHWVKPELVCEVEFTEWTDDGRLRHPSFQGLREDKPARSVVRELPIAQNEPKTATRQSDPQYALVGGIRVSHPGRLIYPDLALTKLQLVEYYEAVAEQVLPHLRNRPLSLLRCPDGVGKPCFFQRHLARGQSPHVHEAKVTVHGRDESYVSIDSVEGLLALAQWGVIELHPWGCLTDDPERPDRIIFDLDPDAAVSWHRVVEAAQEIRHRMREFGLESFVKTTGGKGLHIVVPITRTLTWQPIKALARAVAESLQHDDPRNYIARSSKSARLGKIFVDYLRNDITATAVAPYSARAREGAMVSWPVSWEQLTRKVDPGHFTIQSAPHLLASLKKDPWRDFFRTKQKVAAKLLKALKIET